MADKSDLISICMFCGTQADNFPRPPCILSIRRNPMTNPVKRFAIPLATPERVPLSRVTIEETNPASWEVESPEGALPPRSLIRVLEEILEEI
jgi:hypothetical protein